jgi:hypothetical protein
MINFKNSIAIDNLVIQKLEYTKSINNYIDCDVIQSCITEVEDAQEQSQIDLIKIEDLIVSIVYRA